MSVEQLFPTPLARVRVPDCASLNEEIHEALHHWREENAGRPGDVDAWKVVNGWEIGPDFFGTLAGVEPVHRLRGIIEELFLDFVNRHHLNVDFAPPRATRSCAIEASWATVTCENAFLADEHVHHGTHFVGVYYLKVPARIDGSGNQGGYILLRDPRPGMHVIRLGGQKTVELIRPEEGLLLFFPAYVSHAVRPFQGQGERISINCNLRITGLHLAEAGGDQGSS